jgi:Na+/H+ antiporter NhaB
VSVAGITAFAGVLTALALVISAAGGFITALAKYRRWRDDSDDADDDFDQLREAREALDKALEARSRKPKSRTRRRAVDFTLAGVT